MGFCHFFSLCLFFDCDPRQAISCPGVIAWCGCVLCAPTQLTLHHAMMYVGFLLFLLPGPLLSPLFLERDCLLE
jgi:hypothetical protein